MQNHQHDEPIAAGHGWPSLECMAQVDVAGLGARLRVAREKAGLTQEQLASRAGVITNSVHRYETKGTAPSAEALMRICCALDVTPYWLMCGEEPAGSAVARPPHPSLDAFFETPEGSTVTKAEERELRRLRFPFEPSHLTWHYALATLRSVPTVRPSVHADEEHESQIKKRGMK